MFKVTNQNNYTEYPALVFTFNKNTESLMMGKKWYTEERMI